MPTDTANDSVNDLLTPELDPSDRVQFVGHDRPVLQSGHYEVVLRQRVLVTENGVSTDHGADGQKKVRELRQPFAVLGEQCVLPPDAVHAVFPPEGCRGDFWQTLPHVLLTRSSLPWERTAARSATNPATDPPWLALLVFHEDEVPAVKTVPLRELHNGSTTPFFPGIDDEQTQDANDPVQTISIPREQLEMHFSSGVAPNNNGHGLTHLAHVRRRLAKKTTLTITGQSNARETQIAARLRNLFPELPPIESGSGQPPEGHLNLEVIEPGKRWVVRDHRRKRTIEVWLSENTLNEYSVFVSDSEFAVVLANRLPKPRARNVVHLVSVEGRFTGHGPSYHFELPNSIRRKDPVRLITLKSWQFFCEDPTRTFTGLINGLNGTDSPAFQLPVPEAARGTEAELFLRAGQVPLPHFMRRGDRSVSWYHGPLIPQARHDNHSTEGLLPAATADQLVIWDVERGLADVSYAAAWELGRLLTLQNTSVALAQFRWKRQHARNQLSRHRSEQSEYRLPVVRDARPDANFWAPAVRKWHNELDLLLHIPFQYLVPDERLLPPESLRIFYIDTFWMRCLKDGARSIGRVASTNPQRNSAIHNEPEPATLPENRLPVCGLLIRSELIAGWPGLLLDAWRSSDRSSPARLLRKERLSKNVLLCLFAEDVSSIDLYLRPEMLQFGFDVAGSSNDSPDRNRLTLFLRDQQGNPVDRESPVSGAAPKYTASNVPSYINPEGVVNLAGLQRQILNDLSRMPNAPTLESGSEAGGNLSPAILALQLVSGVERVELVRNPGPGNSP